MPSLKKQNPNLDAEWFQNQLRLRQLTVRGLAKLMDLNPSTVSLLLRGFRSIHDDDVVKLADIFGCSTVEIMKRAGAPIRDEVRTVPVSAFLGPDDIVHMLPEMAANVIEAPHSTPANAYALQIRTGRLYDGWLLIVSGSKLSPSDCIGTSIVYCRRDGVMGAGIIQRGYVDGLYNIVDLYCNQDSTHQNLDILWGQSIVWVKPRTV